MLKHIFRVALHGLADGFDVIKFTSHRLLKLHRQIRGGLLAGRLAQRLQPRAFSEQRTQFMGQPGQHRGLKNHHSRMKHHPAEIRAIGKDGQGQHKIEAEMMHRGGRSAHQNYPPVAKHHQHRQHGEIQHMKIDLPGAAGHGDRDRDHAHQGNRQAVMGKGFLSAPKFDHRCAGERQTCRRQACRNRILVMQPGGGGHHRNKQPKQTSIKPAGRLLQARQIQTVCVWLGCFCEW